MVAFPSEAGSERRPWSRPGRAIAAQLAAEREQWMLWIPVAVGAGVSLYFALPVEPPLWPALLIAGIGCATGYRLRNSGPALLLASAVSLIAIGVAVAQLRTASVTAPMLTDEIGPVRITGRILAAEPLPAGRRLLLDELVIEGVAPESTPSRIRLRVTRIDPDILPGDRVQLLAKLAPPSPPMAPGAYDFQRDAFFQQVGGIGFALGTATRIGEGAEGGFRRRLELSVERLRLAMGERIRAALPGRDGPVAAALIVGTQTGIDRQVMDAMRDSGLAHLLSISGVHIGFVAAIIFGIVRGGLSLVPPVALRYPIKKWAAVAALLGTFFYMILAGSPVPTQRAFLMTGLVMLAVLVDRVAITLRLVAWAALVVLLVRPEAVIGPSFQMSFAAVAALVAAYEGSRVWRTERRSELGWFGRALLYLGGLVLTSVIAGLATAPFALYHFNRFADYSVVANMLAVPLTGVVVMPMAVVAVALMPLGLESWPLAAMGWGVEGIIRIAEMVAGWPGSVMLLPAMPVSALAVAVLGELWLLLWRGRWRYIGILPLLLGMASTIFVRSPDILVSGDADLVAVRAADGGLAVNSNHGGLKAEIWLRRAGDAERDPWPAAGEPGAGGRLVCDALGCLYRAEGHLVALAWKAEALQEDCYEADLVISLEPVKWSCSSAAQVIDRFDLWREGGHAVWLDPDGARVVAVHDTRGRRPWVVQRRKMD
jgi:competence protein ComEC